YTKTLMLDLDSIVPSVSGPRRPQDRIPLNQLKQKFNDLFGKPIAENGYAKAAADLQQRYTTERSRCLSGGGTQDNASLDHRPLSPRHEIEMLDNRPTPDVAQEVSGQYGQEKISIGHGDVLIAAITSCTNTSNPGVLIGAGLLAKKAVEKGLSV